MTIFQTMFLAIGLGMDAFSVALSVGTKARKPDQVFRLSLHFGVFQFLMPIIGWHLGRDLASFIGHYGTWVAAFILLAIGIKMLWEALNCDKSRFTVSSDPTRGFSLVLLSVATSIDAFGAGIGMGLTATYLLTSCLIIGVVAAVMTFVGLKLTDYISQLIGRRMEIIGSLILIGLAVKIGFL